MSYSKHSINKINKNNLNSQKKYEMKTNLHKKLYTTSSTKKTPLPHKEVVTQSKLYHKKQKKLVARSRKSHAMVWRAIQDTDFNCTPFHNPVYDYDMYTTHQVTILSLSIGE